jgi:uncharacterized metal-binding protein
MHKVPNCARCPYKASDRLCRTEDGKAPDFCPTRNMAELVEQSLKEYSTTPGMCQFAKMATIQEADGYMNRDLGYENVRASKTRIEAVCKVGRIPKNFIGVGKGQQIDSNTTEVMCNPVLQAMILNKEKTDFNVLLGLCVGHDSLFFKYTEALCTVLAVKDRLLGHNPLAAVYTIDSYYRCLK